jgi:hypothetical protein
VNSYLSSLTTDSAGLFSQRRNRQRETSCARTCCTSSSHVPLPTMCSTAQLHQHATPFPFLNLPNPLNCDRIIVPAGWTGAKSCSYDNGFDAKVCGAWKHDLSSEFGVDDGGSKACAPKQCAALLQGRSPEVRLFHSPNILALIPREELRRERGTC